MLGMAGKVNISINAGETFSRIVTWCAGTPPLPVDLTGCSARMQVRARVESPDVLLDLSTAAGSIVLGGVAGTITLQLSAAQTSALTWSLGVYDLEIVHADATVRRLMAGTVKVSPEITRG